MITADIYQFQNRAARNWQLAYDHPNYEIYMTVEAATPEELIERLAEKLGVPVEIKEKPFCGAV